MSSKTCVVCGDVAKGVNFGRLCCVSCKSFFRRSGSVGHRLVCSKDKQCSVTVTNRRACPKCRLEKCFRMGMKLNSSFSREVKESYVPDEPHPEIHPMTNLKHTINEQINKCLPIPTAHVLEGLLEVDVDDLPLALQVYRRCRCVCKCGEYHEETSCAAIVEQGVRFVLCRIYRLTEMYTLSEPTYQSPTISPYSLMSPYSMSSTDSVDSTMPIWWIVEKEFEVELSRAHSWLLSPSISEESASAVRRLLNTREMYGSVDLREVATTIMQSVGYSVQTIAQIGKQFDGFQRLDRRDREALLKGGCFQIMTLRYGMTLNNPSVQSRDPMVFSLDQFYSIDQERAEFMERFLSTFDPLMLLDSHLMFLLCCIVLFDPTRQYIGDRTRVHSTRQVFEGLLKHHLRHAYDGTDRHLYLHRMLMAKLIELNGIRDKMQSLFNEVPSHSRIPVVEEILN